MQPGFKDVWLSYSEGKQHVIKLLKSGDELKVKGLEGYTITRCTINHIIYWTNEDTGNEIKIVLPEVWLEKDKLN